MIATVIGSALFALATYRTRALPRFGAASLAIGSGILLLVILIGGTGVVAGTESMGPGLIIAGLIAFSIGWIALGATAIRLERPAAATA